MRYEFIAMLLFFEIVGRILCWNARTSVANQGRLPFFYKGRPFYAYPPLKKIQYGAGWTIIAINGGIVLLILWNAYVRPDFSVLRLVLFVIGTITISVFTDLCGWILARVSIFSKWF